jgi:hypothetical protein
MADKPGFRGYFNAGDQTNPSDQQLADDPVFQSMSPFDQELERVRPKLTGKVNNFIDAIAGPPPNEDTQWQARKTLENVLGVDLYQAARHYVNYKQSNPIRRKLTDMIVQRTVNSNADSYINDVLNKKLPYYENAYREGPDQSAGIKYQRAVLAGLRNLLQDKNVSQQVMNHLMDFRQLEQPIPFVQSKVNWLPPE